MSKIVKPVALDETVQATNTKLTTLDTDLKAQTLQQTQNIEALLNGLTAQTIKQTQDIEALLNGLTAALASVKSINGKYGVVVLDSGDVLISKSTANSKTVKQMLTEMSTAISNTPLTFTAEAISGSDGDYRMLVTLGTPS